ncbi:MAG TPA: ATP-binding protein [archaeon]|nr:ATP-binding protein [archaeon]
MEYVVNILKYNLHWREDHTYGYQIKRDLFNDLTKHLDARPIIGIIGLRRTGKTVLLKQVIDHLIRHEVKRDRILYFSFDEENVSIQEVINEFLSRTGQDISGTPHLYIFFDEIQKLDGWQTQLKYYYDTHPRFKFFVSGSSSLFLKKKAEESLAGRIFLYHLPVLTFSEFLRLKGDEDLLKKPEMFKEVIQEQVPLYIRRQLPELVRADESFIQMYLESIINKIVYEDLSKVFPVEFEDLLKQILVIVASHPGMITDYETLATDLGITRKTLAKYISYLEKGFLLKKCYNYSKNRLSSEKKMKRLYLTSTTLLFHLWEHPDMGSVVENLVITHSGAEFFWRKGTSELDCVLVRDNKVVPIESKYRNNIMKKHIKGLLKFMDVYSIDNGLVVTKDLEHEELVDGKHIGYVPLWKWLLGSS